MNTEEVLSQLDPKMRKRVELASGVVIPGKAKTPSYGLNRALKGGLQYGRQVLVWGNKSSGKSSMLLQLVALAQQEGKVCAWIDAEMSFDVEWATTLGVDCEKLLYSAARTVNDMVDVGTDLMEKGADLIVVDSISALMPAIFFEKGSDELKQLEDTKQIGSMARDMDHAVRMLNYANNTTKPCLLILVSQSRTSIGQVYSSQGPQGGQATKFFSSIIIKLFSSESEKQAIKGKIYVGDKALEEVVGRKVRWNIDFSKTSAPFQTGEYDFYFRGSDIGVDSVADLVDTAESVGIIERNGAWYTINGERFQGRDRLVLGVKEDLDLQEMLIKKVSGE